MDWIDAAKAFGPLGLVVLALYLLARDWMGRHERIEMRKLVVEEKRLDIYFAVGAKVDAHAAADLESHREMAEGIAGLHGKLDGVLDERDRTPVEGIKRHTPAAGVPVRSGYYPPRPGTKER